MPKSRKIVLVAGPAHGQPAYLPPQVREIVIMHMDREQNLLYSDTGSVTRKGTRLFEYCGLSLPVPK